jgi:colicin import membrane protein
MATRSWSGIAAAGVLLGALGGCAHGQSTPAAAAADRANRASAQAAQTEGALAEARRRAEAARAQVAQARRQQDQAREQLAQAERRARDAEQSAAREQANVQRLDEAARQQREQARQAALQAQAAAEEAQGLRAVTGRISEASPSRVVLVAEDGRRLAFQLGAGTKVLVGAEQRGLSDLQQGADARVAYDPRSPEPAAVTIQVTPIQPRPAPAGQPRR